MHLYVPDDLKLESQCSPVNAAAFAVAPSQVRESRPGVTAGCATLICFRPD